VKSNWIDGEGAHLNFWTAAENNHWHQASTRKSSAKKKKKMRRRKPARLQNTAAALGYRLIASQ
jgi:hypothetical protein